MNETVLRKLVVNVVAMLQQQMGQEECGMDEKHEHQGAVVVCCAAHGMMLEVVVTLVNHQSRVESTGSV